VKDDEVTIASTAAPSSRANGGSTCVLIPCRSPADPGGIEAPASRSAGIHTAWTRRRQEHWPRETEGRSVRSAGRTKANTSIANARRMRAAQVQLRSVVGGSRRVSAGPMTTALGAARP
jgi:hypothetical protein